VGTERWVFQNGQVRGVVESLTPSKKPSLKKRLALSNGTMAMTMCRFRNGISVRMHLHKALGFRGTLSILVNRTGLA
jgi:hypothetical protein